MRRLHPTCEDVVDLAEAYACPAGRPWLRANMISSLDGAAWHDGLSGGLGCPADRRVFRLLRGLADVVLVGAGTTRAEGYRPVRPGPDWTELRAGRPAAPPLAIVSRSLDLDLDAPVFTEPVERTIVITTASAPADLREAAAERADVIIAGEERSDLEVAVAELRARGLRQVLCEGGPRVLAQVTGAGLLDELCLTVSPLIVAGDPGRILNGPPVSARFKLRHVLEEDGYLFLRYADPGAPAG